MTGVYVLLVVLAAATLFGLWRQRTDGRMRTILPVQVQEPGEAADARPARGLPAGGAPDHDPRIGAGQVTDGRAVDGPGGDGPAISPEDDSEPLIVDGHQVEVVDHSLIPAAHALGEAALGQPLGARATLVQFSSAFCAPCRATRVVLGDVAGMVDGVAHIEIDAEAHLDLVRRLDITRTPTVLVLDATGRIRTRATGAPRRADVIAALGGVI